MIRGRFAAVLSFGLGEGQQHLGQLGPGEGLGRSVGGVIGEIGQSGAAGEHLLHLSPGNGFVREEAALAIPFHDAVRDGPAHITAVPGAGGGVGNRRRLSACTAPAMRASTVMAWARVTAASGEKRFPPVPSIRPLS